MLVRVRGSAVSAAGERLLTERHDEVLHVRLNRPEKRNALDLAALEVLAALGRELASDPTLRAVVLSGEGKSFCAGIDLAELAASPGVVARLLERTQGESANRVQQATWNWRCLPVPVIAALHGEVFGAGLQLALGADLRIAHPDTRLSVMEIRWGLVPDMGGSQTLRGLVRRDVALELACTGRVVEAPEALALGLVTRLDPEPVEVAMVLAGEIARRSPDAVRAAKRLFHTGWETDYAAGLALEAELQSALLGAPNQREAVRAGLAGEPPRFGPAGR